MFTHWSQFVPLNYVNPTSEDIALYIISHRQNNNVKEVGTRHCQLALSTAVRNSHFV